jgi:sec-independent protein translocase protein TatC
MYQVWRFIAPGLEPKEKKPAEPFAVHTNGAPIGGALFTHYIMFPGTVRFLAGFHSAGMKFMPRVEDTFELYKMMLVGMVVVFQIPTLVFFLARMRLVTAQLLWRHFKYAVLVSFIVAAVLTPSPDPWNQTVFALPMMVLYLVSIGIAWLVRPKADTTSSSDGSTHIRLVVGALVADQARRSRSLSRRRGSSVT